MRVNPQPIAEDTSPVFSSSPPRFVKTLKMLSTEPFFTTLIELGADPIPDETTICRFRRLSEEHEFVYLGCLALF